MSNPRRLLEEGGTELEMAMLRAAKEDGPPPEALDRALLAMGLGAGVAGAGAGAGAGASSAGASVASGVLKPAFDITRWLLEFLTWVSISMASGLLFTGGLDGAGASASPEAPQAMTAALATAAPASGGGAPISPAEAKVLPGAVAEEAKTDHAPPGKTETKVHSARSPSVVASNPRPPPETEVGAEAPEPTASPPPEPALEQPALSALAEETALMDSARAAFTKGNIGGAREALARHAQKFPRGALVVEAAVLRIKILAAQRDPAETAAAARAFLKAYPRSPHAGQIKAILSAVTGGKPDGQAEP